jgi:hypothetical protein
MDMYLNLTRSTTDFRLSRIARSCVTTGSIILQNDMGKLLKSCPIDLKGIVKYNDESLKKHGITCVEENLTKHLYHFINK